MNVYGCKTVKLLGVLDLGPGGEGPALHGLEGGIGAMGAGVSALLGIAIGW